MLYWDWQQVCGGIYVTDRLIPTIVPVLGLSTGDPLVKTPSPPLPDEPTPMPINKNDYFAPPTPSPPLDILRHALSDRRSIRQSSISHFLSWRVSSHAHTQTTYPTPLRPINLSSSESSLPSAASSYAPRPMPTVARARGGKEWEAMLSRRAAKKRSRRGCSGLGVPLFSRGVSHVGLWGFGKPGKGFSLKRIGVSWGWVGIAAVVMAVGWGCWAR
jgi:hypothetical protein